MQVFNSTPPNRNPPPSTCKDRARSFQASVTSAGDIRLVQSKDCSYDRTSGCDRDYRVFTHSGDRGFEKKFHQIKDLVHNGPPAKARKISISITTTNIAGRTNTKPISTYHTGAEDKDWDADLDQAESSLERVHQSYQADQGGTTQLDDHTIPHDYYSSSPEPQPGSYPGGKQLTSKNTTYAELQDSLITQEKEDLILQGRVETSMSTETPSTEGY